jgi:hypothetical protein
MFNAWSISQVNVLNRTTKKELEYAYFSIIYRPIIDLENKLYLLKQKILKRAPKSIFFN